MTFNRNPSAPRAAHHGWSARALSAVLCLAAVLVGGCAVAPSPTADRVSLPLLRGWFEGQEVLYVTTDVSHADVAEAKGANFAPRLVQALPAAGAPPSARASAVDKVYAVTNFDQASVFASAPSPIGHLNRDAAYSPLWQLIKVSWFADRVPRTLKSEEELLSAAEKGELKLEATRVVLNCPIVHRGPQGGGLVGVTLGRAGR